MIGLGRRFAEFVGRRSVVEIGGHYASGKSLIADVIKAHLLGKELEKPRWKRIENTDGLINGDPSTVSFVNARYDFLNMFSQFALRARNHDGPIIISNRPSVDMAKVVPLVALPGSQVKINVNFPKGEPRPKQIGPLKFGPQVKMGNRIVTFETDQEDLSIDLLDEVHSEDVSVVHGLD